MTSNMGSAAETIGCLILSRPTLSHSLPRLAHRLPDKQDVMLHQAFPQEESPWPHVAVWDDCDDWFKFKPHLWIKNWPSSYICTSCFTGDIAASSCPVMAVTTLVSRTVWTLRLPGSCLFPDLKQIKSKVMNEMESKRYERDKTQGFFLMRENVWFYCCLCLFFLVKQCV